MPKRPPLFRLFCKKRRIGGIVWHSLIHIFVYSQGTVLIFLKQHINLVPRTFSLEKVLGTRLTTYMLFSNRKNIMNDTINLIIDENVIDRVRECKFLGTVIDENQTWKPHISLITSKISKNIGIMFKVGQFLTKETTKTLYYTLVYPYINYRNVIWANNPTRLSRIVNLCNCFRLYLKLFADFLFLSFNDFLSIRSPLDSQKCPSSILSAFNNIFTALNNFISKTVIHRKEKYNTYINANLNGKNNCWITKGKTP